MKEAIVTLKGSSKSAIARRGARLLDALLAASSAITLNVESGKRRRNADSLNAHLTPKKRQKSFDMITFIRDLRQKDARDPPETRIPDSGVLEYSLPISPPESRSQRPASEMRSVHAELSDGLATQDANDAYLEFAQDFFGGSNTFEDLLYLASSFDHHE